MFSNDTYSVKPFATISTADSILKQIVTKYFSSHGFATLSTDTPANTHYEEGVVQPLFFNRNISDLNGLSISNGSIEINNLHGKFDSLLEGFSIDGREIKVLMGRPEWNRSQFGTLFQGSANSWEGDLNSLTIDLRDGMHKINVEVQTNFYLGTGGLEGSNDLKGKRKPLCYGQVFNIPAIIVDTANLIYQVHDGKIQDVTSVYDRGVSLTKVSSAPSLGEYRVSSSIGTFTLGGSPDGTVTADVQGDNSTSYITRTADIIERIVKTKSGLGSSKIDSTSFTQFNLDSTASIGIWISEERTIPDVLNELVSAVGGFTGFTKDDKLQIGILKDPESSTAKQTFKKQDILSIEQGTLPDDLHPAVWRRQVGYQKNYRIQTDIAGSVASTKRSFIQEGWRIATKADALVKTRHLLAKDPLFVPALYINSSDAENEAQRLLDLYKVKRYLYTVIIKQIGGLDLNDVVTVDYPRWNLNGGKKGRIVGISIDAQNNQSILTLLI